MPDGSVALDPTSEAAPQDRLLAALSRAGGHASAPTSAPGGAWFLFDTPSGQGAFRPLSLRGLAVPAPDADQGAAAAAQVAQAEAALALTERAVGVAVEPTAVGEPPEGVEAQVEVEGAVLLVRLPTAVASALPPGDAPVGAVPHRIRMAAPSLGEAEIPAPGDLLLLGAQSPCEVAPSRPHGAAAFAATIGVPGDAASSTPPGAGAVVAFEVLLTPGQAAAVRAGALLTVSEGALPAGIYAAGGVTRTGRLAPLGDALAFRFD